MVVEYVVRRGPGKLEATVLRKGSKIASIKEGPKHDFKLVVDERDEYILTSKVHGEFRPFSIAVRKLGQNSNAGNILTVREHLFKHNGKFYMLTNHPAGKRWHESLSGSKYISRLDNFPYSELEYVDANTWHRLRRFRGVTVGELAGLGSDGHHVMIEDELEEIGLFLAATSYLLYSAG